MASLFSELPPQALQGLARAFQIMQRRLGATGSQTQPVPTVPAAATADQGPLFRLDNELGKFGPRKPSYEEWERVPPRNPFDAYDPSRPLLDFHMRQFAPTLEHGLRFNTPFFSPDDVMRFRLDPRRGGAQEAAASHPFFAALAAFEWKA